RSSTRWRSTSAVYRAAAAPAAGGGRVSDGQDRHQAQQQELRQQRPLAHAQGVEQQRRQRRQQRRHQLRLPARGLGAAPAGVLLEAQDHQAHQGERADEPRQRLGRQRRAQLRGEPAQPQQRRRHQQRQEQQRRQG